MISLRHMFGGNISVDSIIAGIVLLLGIHFEWEIGMLVLGIFFVAPWAKRPIRYFIWVAIFFLLLIPLFMILKKESLAEELATYTFYILFLLAILLMRQAWRERPNKIG